MYKRIILLVIILYGVLLLEKELQYISLYRPCCTLQSGILRNPDRFLHNLSSYPIVWYGVCI